MVLWAGLILSAANDEFSAGRTGGWLGMLLGDVPSLLNIAVRKTAHLVVYGILAALTWRADRRWAVVLSVALLVAGTDEWLQSRTATRTGSPWDVALDLAGASGVRWLCHRFQARRMRAGG